MPVDQHPDKPLSQLSIILQRTPLNRKIIQTKVDIWTVLTKDFFLPQTVQVFPKKATILEHINENFILLLFRKQISQLTIWIYTHINHITWDYLFKTFLYYSENT